MAVSFDGPGKYRLEPPGRPRGRVAARRGADAVGAEVALALVGTGVVAWF